MSKYSRRRKYRPRKPRTKKKLPMVSRRVRLPPLAGYPKSRLVRLRYTECFTLNPASGALDVHYYSANGMYDPTVAFGGHQPRGFDQQMLGYEHYTVIGSKATVTIQPQVSGQVGNSQTPFIWGISVLPTAGLGTITTTTNMLESRLSGGSYRVAGSNQVFGAGVNSPKMTRKFSARKFFRKTSLTGQGQFSGSTSANPNEQAFFAIWGGPADGAVVDPDGQNMFICIDYIAVLSEPKILAQS